MEAANAVEDAKLEKKQLEESQAARKGLVKTALLSLVSNEQAQKDAGIWPLPNLEECLNFESVKLLYEPKDAHDEPDVKGSYSSIAAELDELRDKLKAELFDKHSRSVAPFDSGHSYLNRDRRDESIVPHLPTPQGADGTYTFEQKEAVLALATTVFDCRDRHDYPYRKSRGAKPLLRGHTSSTNVVSRPSILRFERRAMRCRRGIEMSRRGSFGRRVWTLLPQRAPTRRRSATSPAVKTVVMPRWIPLHGRSGRR